MDIAETDIVAPDRSNGIDLGRFAEPAVLVLVSLSGGPRHGYAIMADVEAFSGSALGPGTLYAVLTRLERAGLVEPLPADDRRRPYRITAAGSRALAERLSQLERFVQVGRRRLPRPEGRGA
jgi:DNA-binding PadR family transcriptional regulator